MTRRAGVVDGLLVGRYRLAHRLAAGGMGEVWRARDVLLHRDVAVKGLRPELVDDLDVRARFRAEAQSAGRLDHPRIAAVHDFVEDDEGAWLVMELVDGEALSTVLRREGRLSAHRTLDVVQQTATALQAAHDAGVVHRDVKPGNLLVSDGGDVSVTDFGIASAAGAASLTRTGELVGTAGYLSPEQASGAPATAASDLYALGVVAYECLAGRRPFEAENPVAVLLAHLQAPPPPLAPDVDRRVADLVMALLAKDPADRPRSAAELAEHAAALRHRLSDEDRPPVPSPAGVAGPPSTQALPVVDPYPSGHPRADRSTAVPAPLDHDPAAGAATGLAGRPGQRRAVRATALVLGLLAVGFGVRGSFDSPAPQEVTPAQSAPPAGAPASPAAGSGTPAGTTAGAATVVPPPGDPAPQVPVRRDAGPAPASGSAADQPAGTEPGSADTPADRGDGGRGKADGGRGNGEGNGARGTGNGQGNGNGNGNGNGSGKAGGGRGGGS